MPTRFRTAFVIAASLAAPGFALAQGAGEMNVAISADGTRISFDRVGSGPVLIIVSGAASFRALDQNSPVFAGLLEQDFTIVTYDRRGRGGSTDTLPYAPDREIEDIAALVEANGGRASLVGFSSGAVLALEAAAAGLPLDAVVLYEPPLILPGADFPQPPADAVETINRLVANDDRGEAVAYFMGTVGTPPEEIDRMRQAPTWPALEGIAHTMAYDWEILFNAYYTAGEFPDRWRSVDIPVLIANGGASLPFMPATADALAELLPNAERVTLPDQGHNPSPEVLAPAIREFLAP